MRDIEETTVGDFRKMQAEYLNRVCFGHDAIKILKHGKTMGVVISEQDFERYLTALAAAEKSADARESGQALEEVPDSATPDHKPSAYVHLDGRRRA